MKNHLFRDRAPITEAGWEEIEKEARRTLRALLAARRGKRLVSMREFEDAKDKVLMGSERRSMAMNEEEKRLTAYHEAGHAIVAMNVKMADPVHKATIVPRGQALGMVMQLPEGDRYSMKYQQMVDRIAIMAGGRVAEELIFGKENITSGASSDIEQATKLARAMVTRWGFSDKLGHVAYGDNQEEVFLGHSVARSQNVSEETARLIDEETKRLVQGGFDALKRHFGSAGSVLSAVLSGAMVFAPLFWGIALLLAFGGFGALRPRNTPARAPD